jgi:hypothetical protein
MAPFVLCSKLLNLLKSNIDDEIDIKYSHIINVTALEGKFNCGKKSGGHVHTNMSKAAINMLTLTSSRDYARNGIIMNCCDTGWCTDMCPNGVGAVNRTHETFVGPPLDDEDGASRVLDPIFTHTNDYNDYKKKDNRNAFKIISLLTLMSKRLLQLITQWNLVYLHQLTRILLKKYWTTKTLT